MGSAEYKMQLASDVERDGLGLELLGPNGGVVAEVFRSDRARTVVLTTFRDDVPLDAVQHLIGRALERLDPFEDGAPLAEAANFGQADLRLSRTV